MRRLIAVGGSPTDCGGAKGCILGAGNVSNLKEANGRRIFFDPSVPPKVATLTVSPRTNLADHQLVTVSGKGYAPSTTVYISQCVSSASPTKGLACDYATQRYVKVGSRGAFTAKNFVLERRQVSFNGPTLQRIDCAAAPRRCDIQAVASSFGSSKPVKVPLTFNPHIHSAIASAGISPSSQLTDLEPVTLTGDGFTPGYAVNIVESSRASRRPAPRTPRRRPGACELMIQGTQSQPPKTIALDFDPNVPAVTPAITANPDTGLTDNQRVAVTLSGFTPDHPVQILECAAEVITHGDFSYCDFTTTQVTTLTGPTGQTSFVVRAVLGSQGGLEDCTTGPGACVLVASASGGYYFGSALDAARDPATAVPKVGSPADGALVPCKVGPGTSLPNAAFTSLTFAP